MNISERAQEILEKYWVENKEAGNNWRMEIVSDDPGALELIQSGFAAKKKDFLELTRQGWDEARSCVRRHRLAERLVSDVFDVRKDKIHKVGCEFEHVIQKDVEENICTLLGHPDTCPHGTTIPEGSCCRDSKRSPRKLIMALSECEAGEKGKVAYLKTDNAGVLNKLMAMGILPGLSIRLMRRRPAYLFKVGESQFAVDKKLAEKIIVRLSK